MKARCLTLMLSLSVLLPSISSAANYSWVQIELVIFKRANFTQYIPEHLPKIPVDTDPIIIMPSNASDAADSDAPYQYLPHKQLTLHAVAREIGRHTDNTVIADLAWRQPIKIDSYGKIVQFFAGQRFAANGTLMQAPATPPADTTRTNQNSQPDLSTNSTPTPVKPTWEIAGHMQIEKLNAHYNLRAFITVHEPLNISRQGSFKQSTDEIPQGIKTVILKQVHLLAPDKLSYFDHPALGMIMLIKPYTPKIDA